MKQLITLSTGASLLLIPMEGTETVTILISVKVGSRNEEVGEQGLSHLLEHMFFKGSQAYPTAQALSSALDTLGADYNAGTGKEITEYYIKVPASEFTAGMNIISDLFLLPLFPANELASEKQVVLQEIRLTEDAPERYVDDLMEMELFTGSSLGQLILGNRQTVAGFERTDLTKYHKRFYQGPNTLITIAGKLPTDVQKITQEVFASQSAQAVDPPVPIGPWQLPRLRVVERSTEQAHVSLSYPALPFGHPERSALRLLSIILGGTMSSRLFQELREKRGLCYAIRSHAQGYSDTGYVEIQAALDPSKIEEAMKVIAQELYRSLASISQEELLRAKSFVKGKLLLHLEQSDDVADYYATQQLLTGQRKSPAQLIAEINQVTTDELTKLASKIFTPSAWAMAIIGQGIQADRLEVIVKND